MNDSTRRSNANQRRRVRARATNADSYAFFNLLTSRELLGSVEAALPAHRERLFPPTETLSMFLAQALAADRSCQNAVNQSVIKRLRGGFPVCSTHTGAYCRARRRLPMTMVTGLARQVGEQVAARVPAVWHWRGRAVRLVDGTTLSLPDTPANQSAYPQSRTQKSGLGFPLCRLVAIMCLGSGALLNAAIGPYRGKGGDEHTLLRSILSTLNPGDILLGDGYYASYFMLAALAARGVDGLFKQQGSRRRKTDFRRGHRLGARDHLITLVKPKLRPAWMSAEAYASAPDTLTVRETRTGGKTLVTTLTDPKRVSKKDLKMLYKNRWQVELDLRQIKATLGMGILSCKTPAMAEKEAWVYLLAYNLVRLMMAQAALLAQVLPRELSFKHTLQLFIAWRQQPPDNGEMASLFVLIAQQRVGNRAGRIEPRAVKRRPKPFPLLSQPRPIARDRIRKYGHPKKAK
jgi:hypothetical protein